MGKLSGKIALITGGTTGIGYATARLFRDEGARVIITGANAANLEAAGHSLGVTALHCDQGRIEDIQALMGTIARDFERLDILFANAGIPGTPHMVASVGEDLYDQIMGINVKGVYFTVQKALPLMPDGSTIVLTASIGAYLGMQGSTIYAASKAAVRSLGRGFAAELMQRRIRVNTLTPGLIDTPLMGKLNMPAEALKARMMVKVPMGRIGEPSEAATAALFLACADSSFMTGAELVVAGGQTDL